MFHVKHVHCLDPRLAWALGPANRACAFRYTCPRLDTLSTVT
jgi:hypothetical protein